MRDLRMYILVNQDIKINKGKLAGQVGHAVAVYFYQNSGYELIKEYMEHYQKKIIVYYPEDKLLELEEKGFIAIRDKGWTDLKPNTLTCINLGILDFNNICDEYSFVKELKLVK